MADTKYDLSCNLNIAFTVSIFQPWYLTV